MAFVCFFVKKPFTEYTLRGIIKLPLGVLERFERRLVMFFFKKMPSISTRELEDLLPTNPKIIDVREPHEFKGGHIPSAKNIPLGQIAKYEIKTPTYIICHSGMRSKKATKILLGKDYPVINVNGGMLSWQGPTKGGNK